MLKASSGWLERLNKFCLAHTQRGAGATEKQSFSENENYCCHDVCVCESECELKRTKCKLNDDDGDDE